MMGVCILSVGGLLWKIKIERSRSNSWKIYCMLCLYTAMFQLMHGSTTLILHCLNYVIFKLFSLDACIYLMYKTSCCNFN